MNDYSRQTDITFAYNANFFLYATLENVTPISPGTAAGPSSIPVLTGVPVAGMAYLDRPNQAGYFIFPDLSVRHEGRYRLCFHLYEETKDPKDADRDDPLPSQDQQNSAAGSGTLLRPQTYLNYRLDVKSQPFVVYSAKKFPGLTTSTSLCHIIAEQGCRVRIRRDIRMRGHSEKHRKYGHDDPHKMHARSKDYATPDMYAVESSTSRGNSVVEQHPHSSEGGSPRRPSTTDYELSGLSYRRAGQRAGAPPRLEFGSARAQHFSPQLPPTPLSISAPQSSSIQTGRSSGEFSKHENSNGLPAPPRSMDPESSPPKVTLPPFMGPSKPMEVQQHQHEQGLTDPKAYRSGTTSPAPKSPLPSLPPLRNLSGDYTCNSLQPLSTLGNIPNKDSLSSSKRAFTDAFPSEERGSVGLANTRPRYDEGTDYSMMIKDLRSGMEYKRANGRTAMKVYPTTC